MMLEIARFWAQYATFNSNTGRYEINGVMGPDEFHEKYPWKEQPGLNNNAYTNVMVVWLLRKAIFLLDHVLSTRRRKEIMTGLHIRESELKKWKDITKRMTVIIKDDIIMQFEHYDRLKV